MNGCDARLVYWILWRWRPWRLLLWAVFQWKIKNIFVYWQLSDTPHKWLKYLNTTGNLNHLLWKRLLIKSRDQITSYLITRVVQGWLYNCKEVMEWRSSAGLFPSKPGPVHKATVMGGGGDSLFSMQFSLCHQFGCQVFQTSYGDKWLKVTNIMGQMLEQNVHNIKTTYFSPSHSFSFDEAGHEKGTSEVVPWYLALGPWQWIILVLWGLGGAAPLRPC